MKLVTRKLLAGVACIFSIAVSASAFADGGSLADIKARGQLTVGTEAAYEPFEFVQNGKVVGYGHDILEIMAKKLGVKLNQQNLPFQGLLPGLMSRKFDFVATSVGINSDRAKRFLFTRPVGIVDSAIIVRSDNTSIRSPEDLNNTVLGTQLGSSSVPIINEFNQTLKDQGKSGIADTKLFTAYPDVTSAIENKAIVAGVIPSNIASVEMKANPGKYKEVGKIGQPKILSWVVNPKDKGILTFVNDTLDELQKDGTLAKLQTKWFGHTMTLPSTGYLPEGALQ